MLRRLVVRTDRGFSLVEMLVALVFTMILMAGMATVFKSSLTTFYTAGEKLASVRRNRSAIDLLYEDLNAAGMFLTDLSAPPSNLSTNNPAFYILPNMLIAGATADGPATADELYFYFDQPLAFEATLISAGDGTDSARTAAELVLAQEAQQASDNTFRIECRDAVYADSIHVGQQFIGRHHGRQQPCLHGHGFRADGCSGQVPAYRRDRDGPRCGDRVLPSGPDGQVQHSDEEPGPRGGRR